MCELASYTKYKNDLLKKHFGNSAGLFLGQLIYWSNHKNQYGILKNDRIWIYNTLENWAKQLDRSSKTVQRVVKYLKEQGVIETNFMAKNKRDRTIFYSVNYEALSKIIYFDKKNVQSDVQMIHINNKQKINKSDKSKILKRKNTTVQDMTQIWNETFPSNQIKLTKEIARYLVAAFKNKFKQSLDVWKNYINALKNNNIVTVGKLIFDYIKFYVIDRFLPKGSFQIEKVSYEESLQNAINHIESVPESKSCKDLRYKIVKKLSPEKYNSWFTKVVFVEGSGEIKIKAGSSFVKDHIMTHFCGDQEFGFVV